MKRLIVIASVVICAWGLATQVNTQRATEQENSNAGTAQRRVIAIANEFVAETFAHFPAQYPASGRYGELGDNSIAALRQWQQKEGGWIEALRTIDPDLLEGTLENFWRIRLVESRSRAARPREAGARIRV